MESVSMNSDMKNVQWKMNNGECSQFKCTACK